MPCPPWRRIEGSCRARLGHRPCLAGVHPRVESYIAGHTVCLARTCYCPESSCQPREGFLQSLGTGMCEDPGRSGWKPWPGFTLGSQGAGLHLGPSDPRPRLNFNHSDMLDIFLAPLKGETPSHSYSESLDRILNSQLPSHEGGHSLRTQPFCRRKIFLAHTPRIRFWPRELVAVWSWAASSEQIKR